MKMRLSYFILVTTPALALYPALVQAGSADTQLETQFDKKVKDEYNFLEKRAGSMLECAALCAKDRSCMSMSYNSDDGTCQLSRERINGPEYQDKITTQTSWRALSKRGSKVGDSCADDIPCVNTRAFCADSTCFCHSMFVYNDTGDCTRRCSTVEDAFDYYANTFTDEFDDWNFTVSSVDECESACLGETECFHYEYWNSGKCIGGKVSYGTLHETKPGNIRSHQNSDLFSRRCT